MINVYFIFLTIVNGLFLKKNFNKKYNILNKIVYFSIIFNLISSFFTNKILNYLSYALNSSMVVYYIKNKL